MEHCAWEELETQMSDTVLKCDLCGEPATGSINSLGFCNNPVCIESTVTKVARPAIEAVRKAVEA